MGPEIIIDGKKFIQFASNNYLGLTMNKKVINSSKKFLKGMEPEQVVLGL